MRLRLWRLQSACPMKNHGSSRPQSASREFEAPESQVLTRYGFASDLEVTPDYRNMQTMFTTTCFCIEAGVGHMNIDMMNSLA